MGQRQEGCYSGLDEPPGVTDSYSKTDFIAINAIIHSGAMDKCINPKLGYIKPTSSSKYGHEVSNNTAYTRDSLYNLSIGEPLASTTPMSSTLISYFLNRCSSSSIGIDEEHTNEVTLCFIKFHMG